MELEVKVDVKARPGDTVYVLWWGPGITIPCPFCLGDKKVMNKANKEVTCPRCYGDGDYDYYHQRVVREAKIGCVNINDVRKKGKSFKVNGVTYAIRFGHSTAMHNTFESQIFLTLEEAEQAAQKENQFLEKKI